MDYTKGAQYAGLTADEQVIAASDPHMSACDDPRIEDCDSCQIRLGVFRRHLAALAAAGRLLPAAARTTVEREIEWRNSRGRVETLTYVDYDDVALADEFKAAAELGSEMVSHRMRTIHEFPDGSTLVGPWVPVDEAAVGDRWTAEELAAIKARARQKAANFAQYIDDGTEPIRPVGVPVEPAAGLDVPNA